MWERKRDREAVLESTVCRMEARRPRHPPQNRKPRGREREREREQKDREREKYEREREIEKLF